MDSETGLYYYGARYLDPRMSRSVSADPAMGDYLPEAPVSDEARRHNGALWQREKSSGGGDQPPIQTPASPSRSLKKRAFGPLHPPFYCYPSLGERG